MSEQIIKLGKLNMDENKTNPARQARQARQFQI
jgi:hypothetical protein